MTERRGPGSGVRGTRGERHDCEGEELPGSGRLATRDRARASVLSTRGAADSSPACGTSWLFPSRAGYGPRGGGHGSRDASSGDHCPPANQDRVASPKGSRFRTDRTQVAFPGPRTPDPGPRYCELHAHTAFSFLEGASEPEAVAERAAHLGLPAVAVTDRGGVYGIPRFHKAARDAGVAAIVGAEAMLEDGSRLPLLVESPRGWSNLCRLLTTGALHGGRRGTGDRVQGSG
ncbi:MAG: PHP domain-containing protein, partial [Acidobacteriota bacterium]